LKIEIKNRFTGTVIFSHEAAKNTVALTLTAAIAAGANLSRANLYGANLSRANLYGANLSGANLSGANLSGANLSGANLSGADLSCANLYGANLSRANLYGANLYGANLSGANLYGANLSRANLYGADLSGADLSGANLKEVNNGTLVLARTQITPQEGAFVGWKKLEGDIIARLVIPHDAHRFNSYGSRKCRASKVIVHELFLNGETYTGTALDKYTGKTVYATGCEVLPDKFDEDKQVECSHGIHFFITREEAEDY